MKFNYKDIKNNVFLSQDDDWPVIVSVVCLQTPLSCQYYITVTEYTCTEVALLVITDLGLLS